MRMKIFSQIEVGSVPSSAKIIALEVEIGGHQIIHLLKMIDQTYRLWIGGGTPSEPIFKIRHKFETKMEAILYAQFLIAKSEA